MVSRGGGGPDIGLGNLSKSQGRSQTSGGMTIDVECAERGLWLVWNQQRRGELSGPRKEEIMKRLFWSLLVITLLLMVPALSTAADRHRSDDGYSQRSYSGDVERGGHYRHHDDAVQNHQRGHAYGKGHDKARGKGHEKGHYARYDRYGSKHLRTWTPNWDRPNYRPVKSHDRDQRKAQSVRVVKDTLIGGRVLGVPILPLPLPLPHDVAVHLSW